MLFFHLRKVSFFRCRTYRSKHLYKILFLKLKLQILDIILKLHLIWRFFLSNPLIHWIIFLQILFRYLRLILFWRNLKDKRNIKSWLQQLLQKLSYRAWISMDQFLGWMGIDIFWKCLWKRNLKLMLGNI